MKKLLISLLLISFLNYIGCYTFSTLTDEEMKAGRPAPDKHIKLILNDSSEIKCAPPFDREFGENIYLKVDTAGYYLAGKGEIYNKKFRVISKFEGIISEDIDSSKESKANSKLYTLFWTKENNRLSFKQGDFIYVTPEMGTGYFIYSPDGRQSKISFKEINKIQENTINWYITLPVFAALITLPIMVLANWRNLVRDSKPD